MTPTDASKKTSPKDWHPAEVIAALRMKGYSLRQLALLNGYSNGNSLTKALRTPYPLAEALIAEVLDKSAAEIWPSRYDAAGLPNRQGRARPMLPTDAKPSSLRGCRNRQKQAG